MSFVWTQEAVSLLQRFYVREGLSAARAADALGQALGGRPTRNAVLGKAQRLGWTKPAAEAKAAPERFFGPLERRGPIRLPRLMPEVALPPLREVPLTAAPKLWTERRAFECCFPVGDPSAPGMQMCCGAPTGGGTYCPPHRDLMTLKGSALTPQDEATILVIARRAA